MDLLKCLDCIVGQTRQPDQVIVIDNGSADGSLDRARLAHPGFDYLLNEDNVGFAAGANQGIAKLRDTVAYAALLNPDAFAHPDWLQELIVTIEQDAYCGAVASRMMWAEELTIVDGLGDAYHFSGIAWRRHHRHRLIDLRAMEPDPFGVCAGAALYRVSAFRAVGGFDETFFCYMEDVDLAFRLRLAGYTCRLAANAVVEHVGSAATGYRSDFSTYHGHRNLVWTFVKNMPGILFWVFLPLHLMANILSFAVALPRGQFSIVARAKKDALCRIGFAWRQRREIQASRLASLGEIWRAMDHSLWGRA
jgi:GT2 family glycosyltransferase